MTAGSTAAPELIWRDGLPPDEYWAKDPLKTVETPVDSRGLIIVEDLINTAKEYICPEYKWDGPADKHHLYYYAAVYRALEQSSDGNIPAQQFRELAVNKIYIPRRFHNVIHKVMLPADIPSPDVMRNYTEAWTVARKLFASVRRAVRAGRKVRHRLAAASEADPLSEPEKVDEEIMQEALSKHFGEIGRHLGALILLPEEYRPIKVDANIHDSLSKLGGVLLHGRQVRTRAVTLPDPKPQPCNCLHCKVNSSIITPVNN